MKTNLPLISIIVPVYNPGQYIYKCLESLVNQIKKNYEVILVDDGSTDGSDKICKEYCQKYENIRYFYKENSGVSDTRNFGIEKSIGEYITFVDSDDYIDESYTEKATDIINQGYEMIIFNHAKVNGEIINELVLLEQSQDVTCPKILNKYFENYCLSTACKKLFKRNMLIENKINFDNTISNGEDMLFSITAYVNSKKTYYLNYCAYFYLFNESSITNNVDIEKRKKHSYDNLFFYKQIDLLLKEKGFEIDEDLFLNAFLRNFFYGLSSLWSIENEQRRLALKEILELYRPYLEKYNKEKSMLDPKLKMQLQILKKKCYIFLTLYFFIKRKIRKLK